MKKSIEMMRSELEEMKKLLENKEYDKLYVRIQSMKVLLDVLEAKLDELLKH